MRKQRHERALDDENQRQGGEKVSHMAPWRSNDRAGAHMRGRPYHPMSQGKIERWHRSMKNEVLLENYYLPGQLESALAHFVDYYNHERYHESLDNLTPADVYYGRGAKILDMRQKIKQRTLSERRRLHYQQKVA